MKPLEEKALEYARTHLQAVKICWVDKRVSVCSALEAVELCSYAGTAGSIVGVVAQEKPMQVLLEQLIDGF